MTEKRRHAYNAKYLKEQVDRFPNARVLVVGDIIMDEYLWGDVSRISPEAPVPVVDIKNETKMFGGAANVVRNISTLGARPILCGVIGNDRTGKEIIDGLKEMDLTTEGVVVEKDRPTSMKTRVVAHNQQVVRFDRESRKIVSSNTVQKLLKFVAANLKKLDAIVVADYGKGVISDPLMKGLRDMVYSNSDGNVAIAVDPKTGNFEYYQGVDVITPNHHEAGSFCNLEVVDEESLIQAGKWMLSQLKCRSVLITQGRDGMTLFEDSGEMTHIPTVAKKVYDVTGAGDTVIGTFSVGLACGLDLRSAAILSNLAAGIVVGEVGTSSVKAEELKKVINNANMEALKGE
jgi:rfaE bifunctional protein kinase chain/domain